MTPSPFGPAGSLDALSPIWESEANAEARGGLAISRTVSGGEAGPPEEDLPAPWLFGGEGGAGAFSTLAEDAGIPRERPGAASVCRSDGNGNAALTTVTKRARNVAAGFVSVPKPMTSPPRSSA